MSLKEFAPYLYFKIYYLSYSFKLIAMIFKQKGSWWSQREYVIEHNGLRVRTKFLFGSSTKFFDFRDLGKELIHQRKRRWAMLLLALLSMACGVWLFFLDNFQSGDHLEIAAGCMGLSFLLALFFRGKVYLYLRNDKTALSVKFLINVPSEEKLNAFIAHVKKAQRIRLQQLYMTISDDMSYEEYRRNVQWLWDNDFLSEREAEQRLGVAFSAFR